MELKFVYDLYLAAENEVRSTERWILVILGGIYSYLAAKGTPEVPLPVRRLAWYSPTFIVVFAGIRALGLGLRQKGVMDWLRANEPATSWANSDHLFVVTATATFFYVGLAVATVLIANRMLTPSETCIPRGAP